MLRLPPLRPWVVSRCKRVARDFKATSAEVWKESGGAKEFDPWIASAASLRIAGSEEQRVTATPKPGRYEERMASIEAQVDMNAKAQLGMLSSFSQQVSNFEQRTIGYEGTLSKLDCFVAEAYVWLYAMDRRAGGEVGAAERH